MPEKKTRTAKKPATPKRTPKRKTAIPATSTLSRRASNPVQMRLVAPPAEPIEPSHEMIARRAFEIWENYARLAGDAVGHWLEAQKQLREELNRSGI
jgi:hypothetical protein